ncbi:YhgE/Pip domain-containing protein [Eggerthella sp. NSJ-70]|uniref:YhgE/Pip domain-containing protein n=1 Tax=Eggerthella hominis TaxID=2763043 RepID=A0ABR7BVT9_9ACTN|nr:YhgE/Pip domain-containing protein [Eggerthella hominis]MBC5585490.1 YhgE/Pip domain-containing protein [Eggerthella hominis]
MKTVFQILLRDLKRLARNPVAIIVTLGVCVIPSLYAWYSIEANWDPYANTSGIRVAVSNEDAGTRDDVVGDLDVGAEVVDGLRDNTQLGWEFVSQDEAMEGVRSGAYYAAIVIPKSFSEDLVSAAYGGSEKPQLEYYVNEKKNSVAPKVTDAGAAAIEEQINSMFIQTVSKAVVSGAQQVGHEAEDGVAAAEGSLTSGVSEAASALGDARGLLDGMGGTVAASRDSAARARATLSDLLNQLPTLSAALDEGGGLLTEARDAANGYFSSAASSVGRASSLVSSAAVQTNAAIGQTAGDVTALQERVDGLLADAEKLAKDNETMLEALKDLERDHPELAGIIEQLEQQNAQQQETIEALKRASATVTETAGKAVDASQAVTGVVQGEAQGLTQSQQSLSTDVLPQLSYGLDGLSQATGTLSGAVAALDGLVRQADAAVAQLDATLGQAEQALSSSSWALGSVQGHLSTMATDLAALSDSASLDQLSTLLGVNPDAAASFMAAPVTLRTETVFPVDTYGAGVAPFYTNLALWVGGFVLIAIFKLEVDRTGVGRMSPTQSYFGRWLLLVALAAVQAVIVCVGDLVLGVQCVEPVAFVAAGVFASFVYLNIIYALAVAFKHIGKALAVVLLIMQIPGSSGMYPVEMMSGFFQVIHPFLPFTYGIGALREAIGGMYGQAFWIDLAHLALFLPVAFLIGLVARPYLLNINLLFDRKLAETDVMVSERGELEHKRYRLRTVIRALLDTDAYRETLVRRFERFGRNYRRFIRAGFAALAALSVLMLVLLSTVQVDADGKLLMLVVWIAVLVAVDGYLIAIEYVHENLGYQMDLASMDEEGLRDKVRSHLTFGPGKQADAAEDEGGEQA